MAGGKENSSSTADHYQVMVHAAAVAVDEEALRHAPGESSKSDLPCETIRRLCCDSGLVVVTKDRKGRTPRWDCIFFVRDPDGKIIEWHKPKTNQSVRFTQEPNL